MSKKLLILSFLLLASFITSILDTKPAAAANESWRWKTWDSIEASGGDFRNTVVFKTNGIALPNQPEMFQLTQAIDTTRDCVINAGPAAIYLYASGQSLLNGFSIPQSSTGGGPRLCSRAGPDVIAFLRSYDSSQITIEGQRPSRGDQAETKEQKFVEFSINVLDESKAPPDLKVTILKKDGGEVVFEQTIYRNGGSYKVITYLEPGTYILRSSAVVQPVEFTKEKFKPIHNFQIGETDAQRRIAINIKMVFNGSGGQTYIIGPYDVELRKTNDSFLARTTTGTQTVSTAGDPSVISTVTIQNLSGAYFNDISPGDYKVCIPALQDLNPCRTTTKVTNTEAIVHFDLDIFEGNALLSAGQKAQFPTPIKQGCVGNDPLDWLFCSILEGAIEGSQIISEVLDSLLYVNPLTTEGSGGIAFETWQVIRNVANILLIIAMFALIFSQATSVGLNAYGVKRTLPRLVIVGVLLNISFFLCAFAVDAVNVAGKGVSDLLNFLLTNTGGQQAASLSSILQQATGTVLVVTTGVIIFALMWGVVLTGMLLGLIAIAARHGIIIVLVLVSPIAFILWTLPNTSRYAQRWVTTFLGLLAVYPLVMLILAGSRVAATIIVNS